MWPRTKARNEPENRRQRWDSAKGTSHQQSQRCMWCSQTQKKMTSRIQKRDKGHHLLRDSRGKRQGQKHPRAQRKGKTDGAYKDSLELGQARREGRNGVSLLPTLTFSLLPSGCGSRKLTREEQGGMVGAGGTRYTVHHRPVQYWPFNSVSSWPLLSLRVGTRPGTKYVLVKL